MLLLFFLIHPVVSACCSYVLVQAATGTQCGTIGSSDAERPVTTRRDQMFYLNTANPAPCTGNITSWRVCYYGPDSVEFSSYWAVYALYRKVGSGSNENYERVSELFKAVRATSSLANFDRTGIIDGEVQEGGFECYEDFIDINQTPVTVRAGDILGACILDPIDGENTGRQQLDVVGETIGESLLGRSSSGCTILALPDSVQSNQLSTISSRRLHIHANIGNFLIKQLIRPCACS